MDLTPEAFGNPVSNKISNKQVESEVKKDEKTSLITYLKNSADDSSVVGLKHCYDTNRTRLMRGVWIFLVVFGAVLAIGLSCERIYNFFSFPVRTKIDVISEKKLAFPKITICNNVLISKSAAEKEGVTEYLKQLKPPYYSERAETEIVGPIPTYSQELRDALSPNYTGFFCSWHDSLCPSSIWSLEYTDSGRCLAINPRLADMNIVQAGASDSLLLLLPSDQNESFIMEDVVPGFSVQLHNPEEPAIIRAFHLNILSGYLNTITFKTTETTKLKYPYGDCTDAPGYNPVNCSLACVKEEVVKKCGCRQIYSYGDEPVCDFFQELCSQRAINEYFIQVSHFEKTCDCPPLCNSISYESTPSRAPLSDHFFNISLKKLTSIYSGSEVSKKMAFLRIYLSHMEVTKVITEPAYSFMTLLADIGGALSLMLGATLLTLVELAEMGVSAVLLSCRSKKGMSQ